jgi:Ala-tRNA(Pro) deacylase
MSTQITPRALTDVLRAHGVSYELIPHRRTESAAAEARAVGVHPEHVAKTLVLQVDDGFVRAVLPASERLDLAKARQVLGARDVHLASEDVLAEAYGEFELGAVPPIGGERHDPVLVDRHLPREGWVVFEAGSHEHSLRVRAADLIDVAEAQVADLCEI